MLCKEHITVSSCSVEAPCFGIISVVWSLQLREIFHEPVKGIKTLRLEWQLQWFSDKVSDEWKALALRNRHTEIRAANKFSFI
jgi:hypothetical protein